MKDTYLYPTEEAGKNLYLRQLQGPVVMLNLLKYRETADYSTTPELASDGNISGKEAYTLYMQHTLPFLEKAGGEVLFFGKAEPYLIGPVDESWDAMILVKHASVQAFMGFARDEGYLKIAGHRTAALEDSRLLPISEVPLNG